MIGLSDSVAFPTTNGNGLWTVKSMPRNWQDLVSGLSDVNKLVHLSMRQDSADTENIRSSLVKARRREYESELNSLAKSAGCSRSAMVSEGETLNEINDLSKQQADSMVNTYNYDLGIALIAIRTETPTANRHTYARRLAEWDKNRAVWKNAQVATDTVLNSKSLAQRDFMRFNTNVESTATLAGPNPAAEPICQGWLDRGKVPAQTAINNPSPFHANCPHPWEFTPKKLDKGECDSLWMGG